MIYLSSSPRLVLMAIMWLLVIPLIIFRMHLMFVEVVILIVTTPPMVGSTWLRVRSTLESDCFPTLFQGTVSFRLVMD